MHIDSARQRRHHPGFNLLGSAVYHDGRKRGENRVAFNHFRSDRKGKDARFRFP